MKETLLISALLLLLISSCKKNISSEDVHIESTGLLKKTGIYVPSLRSTFFTEYQYDNLSRVIKIIEYTKQNSNDSIPVSETSFYYNNNYRLPYKFYILGANKWHFLTYDTQGRLSKDSILYQINPTPVTGINYFTYSGNTRLGYYPSQIGGPTGGHWGGDMRDSLAIINDNYVHYRFYWDVTHPFDPPKYVDQFNMMFDNKKNPLYFLNTKPLFDLDKIHIVRSDLNYAKNNLIYRESYDAPMNHSFITGNIKYSYTSDDYPIKRVHIKKLDTIDITEYSYY